MSEKRNLIRRFTNTIGILVVALLWSWELLASPAALTYQGRIVKADGTPLEYSSVSFIFQITNPAGSCVIYQEQVTGYNMTNSKGIFDVPIGGGTVTWPNTGSFSILDAFNNSASFVCGACSGYSCSAASGTPYMASSADGRKLKVQFHDGIGWKMISPDTLIRSVPFAAYAHSAQKLGTKTAADFIARDAVNSGATCESGNFLTWNASTQSFGCEGVTSSTGGTVTTVTAASPLSVAAGTASSTPHLTIQAASGSQNGYLTAGDWTVFNSKLSLTTPFGGDVSGTAANISVDKLKAVPLSISGLSTGHVLKYNGSSWANGSLAASDISGLSALLSGKPDYSQFPSTCTAAQTLTFISPVGGFSCTDIVILGSQVSGNISGTAAGFTGSLGGDITGSQSTTHVSKIQGVSVAAATPTTHQVLKYDGAQWAPASLSSGDLPSGTLSGSGTAGYVPYYSAATTLANSAIFQDSGKVGVGTTSPGAQLHLYKAPTTGSISSSGAVVSGTGTNFTSSVAVGDKIIAGGQTKTVMAIANDTTLTVDSAFAPDVSSKEYRRIGTLFENGAVAIGNAMPPSTLASFTVYEDDVNKLATLVKGFSVWGATSTSNRGTAVVSVSNTTTGTTARRALFGNNLLYDSSVVGGTHEGFAKRTSSIASSGIALGGHNSTDGTIEFLRTDDTDDDNWSVKTSMVINASGRVGIGTTTPSTQLEVVGTIKATAFEGPMTATTSSTGAGSASAPSMTFSGDSDTGFYNTASNNTIGVAAGGVNIFNFSSSGLVSPTAGGASITSANGTASSPTYSFAGDPDTGWFSPGANILAASTDGAERVRIDATGNLGIGTASPKANLHIHSAGSKITMSNSNSANSNILAMMTQLTDVNEGLGFSGNPGGNNRGWHIQAQGNTAGVGPNNLQTQFWNGSSWAQPLTLTPTGNVGIGTTSPTGKLHVAMGTGDLNPRFDRYENAVGGVAWGGYRARGTSAVPLALQSGDVISGFNGLGHDGTSFVFNGAARFLVSGTVSTGIVPSMFSLETMDTAGVKAERMVITPSGYMGIGTSNPSVLLDVGVSGTAGQIANFGSGPVTQTNYIGIANGRAMIGYNATNANTVVQAIGAKGIEFNVNNNTFGSGQAMVILPSGNVGIGTTTPATALDVAGQVIVTSGTYAPLSVVRTVTGVGSPTGTARFKAQTSGDMVDGFGALISFNIQDNAAESTAGSLGFVRAGADNAGDFIVTPNSAGTAVERFRVKSDGRVGISTDAPTRKLDVVAGGSGNSAVRLDGFGSTFNADVAGLMSGSNFGGLIEGGNSGHLVFAVKDNDTMDGFSFISGGGNYMTDSVYDTFLMKINANGNVGIGTASPSAKLDVVGTVKATSFEGPMNATTSSTGAGSASAPSMTFSGDNDTGFYNTSSNNTIGVAAGGTNIFNFSSLGMVSAVAGGASVSTAVGTAAAPTFSFAGDTDTGWFSPAANTLAASTGGAERVRIDANGNVGIGVTPTTRLEVSGGGRFGRENTGGNFGDHLSVISHSGTAYQGGMIFANQISTTGTTGIKMSSAFSVSNATLRIGEVNLASPNTFNKDYLTLSGGHVGVGTAYPLRSLHVETPTGRMGAFKDDSGGPPMNGDVLGRLDLGFEAGGNRQSVASVAAVTEVDVTTGGGLNNQVNGALAFFTFPATNGLSTDTAVPVERLRINRNGYVGIGTTTPNGLLQIYYGGANKAWSTTDFGGTFNGGSSMQQTLVGMPDPTGSYTAKILGARDGSSNYKSYLAFYTENKSTANTTDTSVEKMRIDSSGNVGIGTSNPATRLHVATANNSGIVEVLRLSNSGGNASGDGQRLSFASDVNNAYIEGVRDLTTGPVMSMRFGVYNSEKMRITHQGNVGIGTTNPGRLLDVAGWGRFESSSGDGRLEVNSVAGNQSVLTFGSGTSQRWFVGKTAAGESGSNAGSNFKISNFDDSGSIIGTPFTILRSNGNVGIGITNPTQALDVVGNIKSSGTMTVGSTGVNGTLYFNRASDGVNNFSITNYGSEVRSSNTAGAAFFTWYTNNSGLAERMRIDNAGNVGIGTAGPGYKLDVQGGDINASGSVRAAGVALTSDIRYKRDIASLDNSLEKILSIHGVSYLWRTDEFPQKHFNERRQVGVIAQEVEKQFPEVVDTDKNGFKSVNYAALVAPLIEAVKALYQSILGLEKAQEIQGRVLASKANQSELEELKAQNKKLEAENAQMKARLEKIEKMLSAQ